MFIITIYIMTIMIRVVVVVVVVVVVAVGALDGVVGVPAPVVLRETDEKRN